MRVLSLFSGGGLGDYGLEKAGFDIAGQVEIDEYCQKILALRWPEVPKWRDVKTFDGLAFVREHGQPDIVSGGFPCQDISQAGRGAGIGGERSGLWKEMLRIIGEVRPRYVLVENVAILLGRGVGVVLGDLAEIGSDAEWDCISASAIGAPHQRDRVWIVAHADNGRCLHGQAQKQSAEGRLDALGQPRTSSEDVAHTDGKRRKLRVARTRQEEKKSAWVCIFGRCEVSPTSKRHWSTEPAVGRVAHGIANRVDRLKLLGNGQVVQVVQWIGERIVEHNNHHCR